MKKKKRLALITVSSRDQDKMNVDPSHNSQDHPGDNQMETCV